MSDPEPEPERSPLAQAWDIARYAPIGLVMEAPSLLPKLAEKGKQHVRNARFVGEMTVRTGSLEARQRLDGVDGPARELLRTLGLVAPDQDGAEDETSDRSAAAERTNSRDPAGTAGTTGNHESAPDRTAVGVEPGDERIPDPPNGRSGSDEEGEEEGPRPSSDDLAIPDYESLSASQVVSRLPGLTTDELEAVRAFEAAHRGRRTILNKVAQLS